MPEPMISFPPTRNYRPFTRAHLRQRYGPSNPLHELLDRESFGDVYKFVDDEFLGALDTNVWTASNSGGAGVSNFARSENNPCGAIQGDPGTADDADVRLFMTSNEIVTANRRPILMGRLGQNTAVTLGKWEFGFADAVVAGAVLVKATPTSTATDYAVIIRDTDHNTSVDLVTDGGADAVGLVAGAHGVTFATQTWYSVMIALNELRECVFYVNGIFGGVRRAGPDATVTLGVWAYMQNRSGASRTLRIDYVKGYAERVPFSGDAFTT